MMCSAAVIGLYTSYITPVFLRITSGRDKLVPGPFSLGKWYLPIGAIACAWVVFIVVLLLFPPESNPAADTMSTCSPRPTSSSADCLCAAPADYAVVIIMAVFVFASASWIISARKWFKGPVTTVGDSVTLTYDEKQH